MPTSDRELDFFKHWLSAFAGRRWLHWLRGRLCPPTPTTSTWHSYAGVSHLPIDQRPTTIIPFLRLAPMTTRLPIQGRASGESTLEREEDDLCETQPYLPIHKMQVREFRPPSVPSPTAKLEAEERVRLEGDMAKHADYVLRIYLRDHGELPKVAVMSNLTRLGLPPWERDALLFTDDRTMIEYKIPILTDADMPHTVIVPVGFAEAQTHYPIIDTDPLGTAQKIREGV